jgi:hypothetical protein
VPVLAACAHALPPPFIITHETRQLWVQLLCGQAPCQRVASPVPAGAASYPLTDGAAATTEHDAAAVSRDEAEEFISNAIQICINLMNENDARKLMQLALECVEAWLPSNFCRLGCSCGSPALIRRQTICYRDRHAVAEGHQGGQP